MEKITPEEIGKRYDRIASAYAKNRSTTIGLDYLEKFLILLESTKGNRSTVSILDIGCGTGLPLTKQLVLSGAKVTGVDVSFEMLEKAKVNVPEASFIEGDILTIRFNETYDGILAWDSLFHLPLDQQKQAIRKIASLLNPKGVLLFTAGGNAGELRSTMFDTEFYYSSLSSKEYESILSEENCRLILNEIDDPRSKGHRVIFCQKVEKMGSESI